MHSFTFYSPTEVVSGRIRASGGRVGAKIRREPRVLVVYGGGSVQRSGLLGA